MRKSIILGARGWPMIMQLVGRDYGIEACAPVENGTVTPEPWFHPSHVYVYGAEFCLRLGWESSAPQNVLTPERPKLVLQ